MFNKKPQPVDEEALLAAEVEQSMEETEAEKEQRKYEREKRKFLKERKKKSESMQRLVAPLFLILTILLSYLIWQMAAK